MSIKLADAVAYLKADSSQLNRDLSRAEQSTRSWTANISQGIQQGIGQAFTQLAVGGVQKLFGAMQSGVKGVTAGMVGGNAEFEQYNAQFTVLLKNATAAKQRMQELSEFGAKTPFDLPEVVKADVILQGFGLHSQEAAARFGKSGAEIRTIAGDVASGTKASFEEVAGYIGRFSSGSTGEAIARFQELGIVTRQELAGMGVEFSKSGELISPLDEATTILLNHMTEKYGGMMEVQSETFRGMESNLRDFVGNTGRTLGQPIFDQFKTGLSDLLNFLNSPAVSRAILGLRDQFATMSAGAVAIIRGFGTAAKSLFRALFGDFDTFSTNLRNNSGEWGKNIIVQFARGMAAGATAVVQVLNKIAEVISYWLQPHSPPKLLPDLDKWGAKAMGVYFDGFAKAADFDVFSSISSAIGGLFRSNADEGDTGLIGRIFGSRKAIAQAMSDIRKSGGVGADTIKMLESALGSLPPVAFGYVQTALALQQANDGVITAQEEINRLTREYDEALRPLNKELSDIQDKRTDMADEKRIAALQEAIASGALDANEVELAQMEIREKQLKKQIRDTENKRDLELDAADEKLTAAQEEQKAAQEAFDMQAALMSAQQENNDLIKEQIGLLDQLGNALGAAAGGLGALGSGGLSGLSIPSLSSIGDLGDLNMGGLDGIGSIFDGLDIEGLTAEIEAAFVPLNEQAGILGENIKTIRDNLNWDDVKDGVSTVADAIVVIGATLAGAKLAGGILAIVGAIQAIGASGGVLTAISALIAALGGPITIIAALLSGLAAAWMTDFMGMRTSLEMFWFLLMNFGATAAILIDDLVKWLNETAVNLTNWLNDSAAKIGLWLGDIGTRLTTWLSDRKTALTSWFTNVGTTASDWLTSGKETLNGWIGETTTAVTNWVTGIGDKLTGFKDTVLGGLRDGFDWITGAIDGVISSLGTLITKFADFAIPDFLQTHSPPPLADGLRMIREEMDQLSGAALPALGRGFSGLSNPLGNGTAVASPMSVTFTGDLVFKDEAMIQTFVNYLQSLGDDLAYSQFQGSPI